MLFTRPSLLIFILISASALSQERFSSKECLESTFTTKVESQGKLFGLLKNKLILSKRKCLIELSHDSILETVWKIDICRRPIHIKLQSKGSQSVLRKTLDCSKEETNDFCYYRQELSDKLSNYGLIFAEGSKENLEDSHGQFYCAFLLTNNYLDDEKVFSLYESNLNIYGEDPKRTVIQAKSSERKVETGEQSDIPRSPEVQTTEEEKTPSRPSEASESTSEAIPEF